MALRADPLYASETCGRDGLPAGASRRERIRFVESAWATGGTAGRLILDSGWNRARACWPPRPGVEFENTNALGKGKRYARFKVPGGGYLFPAYDLNHAYEDTDVFVSMAKLKNHATCGVTLSMKNCFGILPASIYGDDAGVDQPNEDPKRGAPRPCTWATAAFKVGARGTGCFVQPTNAGYRVRAYRGGPGEGAAHRFADYRWHGIHRGRRRTVDQGIRRVNREC